MALVNTVAFRGVWQKQFQFTNTQNLPFTLPDGGAVKVPMMYQAAEVGFGRRIRPSVPGMYWARSVSSLFGRFGERVFAGLRRSVQDGSGPALRGPGAAVSGPNAEPAGGSAQREEDAALLPGGPAHRPSGSVLGVGPAQNQDGCFPPQVSARDIFPPPC